MQITYKPFQRKPAIAPNLYDSIQLFTELISKLKKLEEEFTQDHEKNQKSFKEDYARLVGSIKSLVAELKTLNEGALNNLEIAKINYKDSKSLIEEKYLNGEFKGERGNDGASPEPINEKSLEKRVLKAVMANIKQPEDGKNAVVNYDKITKAVLKEVKATLPKIKEPPTVKEIFDYLKENLKLEHIPGLKGEIDSYRSQLAGKAYGRDTPIRGGGYGSGNFVDNENVSGSGTSWTLAKLPILNSEKIYGNGQRLKRNEDYTISGKSVTTTNSFTSGYLTADYKTSQT